MNLLPKSIAKFCLPLLVVCMIICFTNKVHAQKQYTTILKNINPEAQSLYHDLSPQGDSLYLKAQSIFYKVTFLNSMDRKVYNFNPPVLESKISLHDIIVGDYTVLVYKKDRIIVFHISRLHEIEKPFELITAKDMHLSNGATIEMPVVIATSPKSRVASEMNMNKIKKNKSFELSTKELKKLINQNDLNASETIAVNTPRPYNLTSLNRANMESREDYRRKNLRPNGKPYY